MNNYKILAVRWWTTQIATIGIVAVETWSETGEWKAYIGTARGLDEKGDKQIIAAYGAGLQPEEAQGFFPHLDIAKYKKSYETPDNVAQEG